MSVLLRTFDLERHALRFLPIFLSGALCFGSLSGCGPSFTNEMEKTGASVFATDEQDKAENKLLAEINILVEKRAIPATSPLSSLAEALDKVAVERSVPLQDLRAAQAERAAVQYERYPKITPTASAPLTGGGDSSIGVNLEQTVWDGGRTRGVIKDADLEISKARVDTWQDRNQVIYDGLFAFSDIQRYGARIAIYRALERDLVELNEILGDRVAGGVADRGEQLRMSLSLQEVQRDIVADQLERRTAEAALARLVSEDKWPTTNHALLSQTGLCSRDWPKHEAPDVAQARVRVMRAENQRNIVVARRMPKLLLGVGTIYDSDGFSKPTAALQVDASDMLGLGRKQSIKAAEAAYDGALRSYDLQKDDTDAELQKLEQNYNGYLSVIRQLRALRQTNTENLELYREQVEAGTIPIAEGITLFREGANTNIDLIYARARALENCLDAARIRGALAPFGISHE